MSAVYEVITERIIALLEQGTVPWQKPWSGGEAPKNLMSKKEYRGINVFLLSSAGYSSPWWMTFNQARDPGGSVKKGEKGTPVIFWKWMESRGEGNPEGAGRLRGKKPQNTPHAPLLYGFQPLSSGPAGEAPPPGEASPGL